MKLKRRNPIAAAWYSYRGLRKLGLLDRKTCLRLALSHLWCSA